MSAFTTVVSNRANLVCTTGVEDEKPIVLFHNQLHHMNVNSGPYLQFAHKATVESNDAEKPTNQDPLTNLEEYKSTLVEALEIEEDEFNGHLATLKEAIDAANTTLEAAKEASESKNAAEKAKKAANEVKYDAFVVFFRAIIDNEDKLTKFLAMTKDTIEDPAKCTVHYSFFKFIFASIVADYKAAPVVDGKKEVTPFTYGSVVAAITAAELPLKSKKATKSDEDEEDNEDEKDEEASKKQKHRKPTLYTRVLKWIITLDIIENRITPEHIDALKIQPKGKGKWPAYNISHICSVYGLAPLAKNLPKAPKGKPLGITLKESQKKALEAQAAKAKKAGKARTGKGKGAKKPKKDSEAAEEKKDEEKAEDADDDAEDAADDAEDAADDAEDAADDAEDAEEEKAADDAEDAEEEKAADDAEDSDDDEEEE